MTKISKFITFWLCLAFILIICISEVKAEVCENIYIPSMTNLTSTINTGRNVLTHDIQVFNINSNNINASYIKGQIYYVITKNNDTYTSNVDWTTTCQNVQDYTTTYAQSYTITYADGSTATISGRNQEIDDICTSLRTQGALTHNINYEPDIINVGLMLLDNNNKYTTCKVDKTGYFECPIQYGATSIKNIAFMFGLEKYSSVEIRYGLMHNNINRCMSDAQSIINNNNTNTQTIHNDNQQQYNFISNSTIDTSTTSNVNNIDVSNSDTKLAVTNFALIPLNFMQSIINSFNSTCSQVCIGNCGSGHDNDWRFVFPCLDFESILGSNLYNIIDSLFAFGMVFAFIRSVRKFFFNALLLTTDASSEVGVFL